MASGVFDPYYVAEVLSDLLSRQWEREIKLIVTPKDPDKETQASSGG